MLDTVMFPEETHDPLRRTTRAGKRAKRLYLNLLKTTLMGLIHRDPSPQAPSFDLALREEGRDWPRDAHTMIGRRRLDNVQYCCESVIGSGVPGDFVECGVWRGGAAILMRAVLKVHHVKDRRIWLFDSFEGLPPTDLVNFPQDAGLEVLHRAKELAVSQEQVEENFRRYDLLDDRVVMTKGWFKDTLPTNPVPQISVLRLDGDYYESTWQCLTFLYPRVAKGGFVIVDDYSDIPACAAAVNDYRAERGITTPIELIDHSGVYWQRGPLG